MFIHPAGISKEKNTFSVMRNWIQNNGYLKYNPDIKLVVIYRGLNKLITEYKANKYGVDLRFKNLIIIDKYIE